MSIMSGLVETEVKRPVAPHSASSEWFVRNAWSVILAGSLGFWLTLAALLIWG